MTNAEASSGNVVVNLLDTARRQTLQKWKFESVSVVTIGRSPEREIVIPDARISRLHVVLQHRDSAWWLMSMGQNGVQVDGEMVDDFPLSNGTMFRLGRQGPVLEFRESVFGGDSLANTAVELRMEAADQLQLDQQKLDDDVKDVVEGDFFQTLLDRADQLRRDVSDA
ncbi:MAG: FHA domain-containing protein [Planctomycetaceae bacterium]